MRERGAGRAAATFRRAAAPYPRVLAEAVKSARGGVITRGGNATPVAEETILAEPLFAFIRIIHFPFRARPRPTASLASPQFSIAQIDPRHGNSISYSTGPPNREGNRRAFARAAIS